MQLIEGNRLWFDNTDDCYNCTNVQQCPLHNALVSQVVLLATEDIKIQGCGFYHNDKEETTHLRIVR